MADRMGVDRRGFVQLAGAATAAAAIASPARAQAAANPNLLWYRQPAKEWTEALPVGNGRIGAMVFGGIASERLQLNEDTLWAGGPYDPGNPKGRESMAALRRMIFDGNYAEAEKFADANVLATMREAPYQTIGSLMIDWPELGGAAPADYRRSLDLDAALCETAFAAAGVKHVRRVVVSPTHQVVAVQLRADAPMRCRLHFTSPEKSWQAAAIGDDTLLLSGRNDPHGKVPGALRFEARLHVATRGGRVTGQGDALVVEGAREITLLIAMATNFRRFDDVGGDPTAITTAQIAAARGLGFDAIAAATTREHRRLFRRATLDLGTTPAALLPTDERIRQSETSDDPALAALYFQYGRYLLIGCSRPGSQPANLQGIWNEKPNPPWSSNYTTNINTQMNYWPAEAANLAECVEPLIRLVRELSVAGAKTARDLYGARGWVCHHNTDIWRATAPFDGSKYGLWPTGGAWLCTHLWDHYDYGRDRAFLGEVYPAMEGAALFFLDTLQADPRTGRLVTNPSLSPENNHGHGSSLIYGPTMDQQIVGDLFDQVLAAAKVLGREGEVTRQIAVARSRLLPMQVGAQGQLQEWPLDWDAGAPAQDHRHVSHLYGLYPSWQIDVERTPDLAKAAARSLDIRGDKATGWATAWRINLWARLRDGARAHGILKFLLGPERTYPNMFDAHPPFQIDGNFGGAAGIVEMLVQSRGDDIRLLPALPPAWRDGEVRGIRTRGGCTVDLTWRGGVLESARVRGTIAGTRVVRLGEAARTIRIAPGREIRVGPRDFS